MTQVRDFHHPPGYLDFTDQITIDCFTFEAVMTVSEHMGDPSAIRHGRIVYMELLCDGDLIAYYVYGVWKITVDPSFMHADLALDLLISKWSRRETIQKYKYCARKKHTT